MLLVGKTREQVEQDRITQLAQEVRAERDKKIAAVQWRKDRYADEVVLGLTPTEPIEPILEYIQELREVPEQAGFPTNIAWPVEP